MSNHFISVKVVRQNLITIEIELPSQCHTKLAEKSAKFLTIAKCLTIFDAIFLVECFLPICEKILPNLFCAFSPKTNPLNPKNPI